MTLDLEFISAGAGSGKTYTLTERLYDALTRDGVRPSGVLATTFTRKAAAELRERVRESLIARGSLEMATAMDMARIGTVNSVCGDLVKRFAFTLGLPAKLDVVEEADAAQLLRETLDSVLDAETLAEFEQLGTRLGIEDWTAEVRGIMDKARANNLAPSSLPAMAQTSRESLLRFLPPPAKTSPNAALGKAIDAALVAAEAAQQVRHTSATEAYVGVLLEAQRRLADDACPWATWVKLSKEGGAKTIQAAAEAVQEAARRYEQHPRLRDDLTRWIDLAFAVAARALEAYAEAKRQRRVIDFVDQERLLLEALDRPEVAAALSEELDLLMVDEFQDTSPIQLALFVRLAALARKTIWVGDLKQAIYGFRGSDVALMQSVLAALPALGAKQIILPKSYRSRPELVTIVNEAFVPAFDGVLTPSQVQLNAARSATLDDAAYEWWTLAGKNKSDIAASLAAGVAHLLQRAPLIECRTTKQARPLRAGDVAILARTNEGVANAAEALAGRGIAVAVERAGLLASPEGRLVWACLRRLEDRSDTLASAEIIALTESRSGESLLADRLAYLAKQPADARSWREADEDANPALAALARLRTALRLTNSPAEVVRALIAQCDLARYTRQWGPDATTDARRLANLDAITALATEYEQGCARRRTAATLPGLLLHFENLAADEADAQAMADTDAVRVLTHHAAKGLEWPAVICLDLDYSPHGSVWGLSVLSEAPMSLDAPLAGRSLRYWPWPFAKQSANVALDDKITEACGAPAQATAEAEARRLLYVSMTRARDLLVFALPAKAKNTDWLDLIGAAWLKPDDGKLKLPKLGRRAIASAVRDFDGSTETPSPISATADNASWLATSPNLAPYATAFVSPSSLEHNGNFEHVSTIHTYGPGFSISGSPDMAQVGEALHACLAAEALNPRADQPTARISELIAAWQVSAHVTPATVADACATFATALTERWNPVSVAVELPLQSHLPNGQILNGRIDMLLETPRGWVLIDHKSNRVCSAQLQGEADKYLGQLEAYAQAIERATGKPVIESVIHFVSAQAFVVFNRTGDSQRALH